MIKASLENGRLRHQQPLTLKLTGQLTIQKNRLLHQNSSNLHQRLMQSSMNKGIALVFCRGLQGQAHWVAIKQALLKSVTPRNHFPQKQMRLKKNRARNPNSLIRKLIFQNQMNPKNPNSESLKKRKPHRRGKTLLRSIWTATSSSGLVEPSTTTKSWQRSATRWNLRPAASKKWSSNRLRNEIR